MFGDDANEMDYKDKVVYVISVLLGSYGDMTGELDSFLNVYNKGVAWEYRLALRTEMFELEEHKKQADEWVVALQTKLDTYERALKALGDRVN